MHPFSNGFSTIYKLLELNPITEQTSSDSVYLRFMLTVVGKMFQIAPAV